MEALAFAEQLAKFNPPIKKISFLSVNNDFGRGAAEKFGAALAAKGIAVGRTDCSTTVKPAGGPTGSPARSAPPRRPTNPACSAG